MARAGFLTAAAVLVSVFWASFVVAQSFGGLARVLPEETSFTEMEGGVSIDLALSQPVPFRVFAVAEPNRLVVDFREVAFADWADTLRLPAAITALDTGASPEEGWTRLVATLAEPLAIETATMQTDANTGQAVIELTLVETSQAAFLAEATVLTTSDLPAAVLAPATPDDGRFVLAIDPGHGGVDPGAVRGDVTEADLVLGFARELQEALTRSGRVEVVLTRQTDAFVPLPTRVTLARSAGADLFLSIHADAIAEGRARGATVYTLSDTASDAAAAALAEQHDRADLLQGVDLHGADDGVANVLLDLARRDTAPRADAFAAQLVEAIAAADLRLHSRPRGEAGFTVLRAADIPSVLLEIGFMSDPRDLANIQSPEWRREMQGAIATALFQWADEDILRRSLTLQ